LLQAGVFPAGLITTFCEKARARIKPEVTRPEENLLTGMTKKSYRSQEIKSKTLSKKRSVKSANHYNLNAESK
jgi:hypothetical protein